MVISKLKTLVYSPQAAMYLMITILSYILLGLYSGRLFDNPFMAWWFILLDILLLVNLVACTIRRFLRLRRKAVSIPPKLTNSFSTGLHSNQDLMVQLKLKLIDKGFKITEHKDSTVLAAKNRGGFRGSLLFHLGLVIIMLGFSVNSLWGLSGKMLLYQSSVAQFPGDLTVKQKGYFFNSADSFQVRLEQLNPEGSNDVLEQVRSSLSFLDNSKQQETKEVKVNYPAKYHGLAWRSQNWGFSPFLIIKDAAQKGLVEDYVNIATHGGKLYYDTLELSEGYQLRVEFFPDFVEKEAQSKSQFPRNPVLKVDLKKADNLITAFVPLGQEIIVGAYQLEFKEYRYWQLMDISYDPGGALIYLGGFMAVAGLIWRVLWTEKVIFLRMEHDESGGDIVKWHAEAEYFKHLFKTEVEAIFGEFAELGNPQEEKA